MSEDDDLPVLTQVLRIGSGRGSGRAGAARAHTTNTSAIDDAAESSLDEILLTDQLVIGAEPRQELEPYVPLTTPIFEPSEFVFDATASSAQDTRATHGAEPEALLGEEAGPERRNAANDADDASRDPVLAIEPAIASADESTLGHPSAPPFDHDAFALRVREAVLGDLSARIDTELDARIAEVLRAELETALAGVQVNLRAHLADAMRDVVRRAVDDEIARMRDTGSDGGNDAGSDTGGDLHRE